MFLCEIAECANAISFSSVISEVFKKPKMVADYVSNTVLGYQNFKNLKPKNSLFLLSECSPLIPQMVGLYSNIQLLGFNQYEYINDLLKINLLLHRIGLNNMDLIVEEPDVFWELGSGFENLQLSNSKFDCIVVNHFSLIPKGRQVFEFGKVLEGSNWGIMQKMVQEKLNENGVLFFYCNSSLLKSQSDGKEFEKQKSVLKTKILDTVVFFENDSNDIDFMVQKIAFVAGLGKFSRGACLLA